MQNITLEITIPVSSEEEKKDLLARYFNGDLQKIIVNSVTESTEKVTTQNDDTKTLNSKMDSILELLNGFNLNTNQIKESTVISEKTEQQEKPNSQQQLRDMLKSQELPERQKPTTGLFSKKSIRRV